MEELFVVKREEAEKKVFIIDNLRTVCPHRNKLDHTRLEITYIPSRVDVKEEELREYIEEHIDGQKLTMEIIPLKILNYFIERAARVPSRHAAPKMIHIKSHSKGEDKAWEMIVDVEFKREIKE